MTICHGKPPVRCGGPYSHDHPFPYVVSLNIDGYNNKFLDITSASCLVGKVTRPYRNLAVITGLPVANFRQAYSADVILVPEQYQPENKTSSHDLALIKLVYPIKLGYHADQIVPSKTPLSSGLAAFTPGWTKLVAHFGDIKTEFTPVLLSTITAEECTAYTSRPVSVDQICGQGEIRNKGVCAGDNGNPLVHNNQLIGIASGKVACGTGESDVFTSVYFYYDWIDGYITEKIPIPSE
ncbi:chymotrypsin-2-like [Aphidius gifuensis]|uniref:chymotrypsin-2-like n=1 Tax=Aphidius gifuensis TaxID=684658 RepID=UPI001CDCA115|nr:chymotrypsin-2-like [Aphidius gifuensis]